MSDAVGAGLMERLGLARETVLSDDGDSFVTVGCRDRSGMEVVLKYVKAGASDDAYRRLRNEAHLMQRLPARAPLRLLTHRESGRGYVVTDHAGGRLLRPGSTHDPRVVEAVADALAVFQSLTTDAGDLDVPDREHRAIYYVKVLAKHLLHLWPAHLSTTTAWRSTAIVVGALPAILRRSVISHGDFLPTNLLFHDEDRSVTFTDLEAATLANHPLYDVLALFTVDDRPIEEWDWQVAFLQRYLAQTGGRAVPDPGGREFRAAYRGLLVFLLVYRLNEARINRGGGHYFDGLAKGRYVRRKLRRLLSPSAWRRSPDIEAGPLATRSRNLARMLTAEPFNEHLARMRASHDRTRHP